MSVLLKMTRQDLEISVTLTNDDPDYEVNNYSVLEVVEKLARTVELYDNVNIEIKKNTAYKVSEQQTPLF
jgi:hypothetical protein